MSVYNARCNSIIISNRNTSIHRSGHNSRGYSCSNINSSSSNIISDSNINSSVYVIYIEVLRVFETMHLVAAWRIK